MNAEYNIDGLPDFDISIDGVNQMQKGRIVVRIRNYRQVRIRIALAMIFFNVGGWIMGCPVEFQRKEAK